MNIAKDVAQQLLAIQAVKLSPNAPFTWASGILSPIYCDNRVVLSYPVARQIVKAAFVAKATNFGEFDVVAGVATAGIPHGALLADALEKPFIYVRDKAKAHGRQNQIEGSVKAGQKVLVIEDLISTGGSSVKAIHALKEADCDVIGILAIFTYGFDEAVKLFQAENVTMDTLSDYDTLLGEALSNNYITSEDMAHLQAWRNSPKTWGKKD